MSSFFLKLQRVVFVFYICFFGLTIHAQSLDTLALLLPDNVASSDAKVTAWIDAAQEEGLHIELLRDSEFLQKGASKYRGIILPDQLHINASDNLVATINTYVANGGKVMLVYDFGVLTTTGVYADPKSRFSSLVGVDYALYSQLGDKTIGLGNITGPENILRKLQVPPGKSMPYTAPAPTSAITSASLVANQSLYLPSNPKDAGGMRSYDAGQFHVRIDDHNISPATVAFNRYAASSSSRQNFHFPKALRRDSVRQRTPIPVPISNNPHAVSGYLYGPLIYPSFVTTGTFSGDALLSSPEFGLVAGLSRVGKGKVLFINLPLTYLKGQTDGMLLNGFLHYFADDVLGLPRLSNQPNGVGGLVLNWHLCSDFLTSMDALKALGVWRDGPFSIHMTAGPDTISLGDGLGFNLPYNSAAKKYLRDFDAAGHAIGSHGGWIHDYYGLNASETNQAEFQQYLELNKTAIEKVINHPIVEYAAPQGNNPLWAMTWLENNHFIGAYFTGHTGLGVTRQYRDGVLKNPNLWIFPIVPFGNYATFEEFQENNLAKSNVINWYKALVDFNALNNTSRLIYMHPNGAAEWSDVVQSLLGYAKQYARAGKFRWYTMTELAQFNTKRQQVSWTETSVWGGRIFNASNSQSLNGMTWILPKATYNKPFVLLGTGSVKDEANNWLVTAKYGTKITFMAYPQ